MNALDNIQIDNSSRIPKYKQVMDSILRNINNGSLLLGEKIPSINELSEEHLLSRDTVEKAYSLLKKQHIIESVKGKGYYIAKTDLSIKANVLFLINKLSTYKMRIFNAFVNKLGANAKVDLDIYHCEPLVFSKILEEKKNMYDHYVIMPHFKNEHMQHMGCTDDILKAILSIPNGKLIVLDRNLKSLSREAGRIYQDFTEDIYNALTQGIQKLSKYDKIVLVYPNKAVYPYPKGIVTGFKRFCIQHNWDYEVLDEIYDSMELQPKDLYIIIEENDLVNLVKQVRDKKYTLGEDIGIISYNDTPLKELLGITVMTTDFKKMGEQAASMILDNRRSEIKNEFNFIDRHSV
ncbi:Transcriptional regulator of rhamnose utilization, GntR family [Croceitalea dokdonensis DOKDO 023]|uniref:Transcriptional regulator of rhamnose utilization, GntR family n=1 Tax=Croceitalea dokdonensis DOKDO 023 TaxID=1300341 RepID=A0A0P7ARN9_9FLAO|nr:GntR family transcriptional regulator [Croceitalea dokdonensis]KPM30571.1 Transcriptional regulator of rhamnose utilization, GntR family [Croceitalea dokdonensis DOKDO 023]